MDKVQINKTLIIIITSLVFTINFRTTFKNIDAHMDLGSYSSLKFDPVLILIKNFLCCFHIAIFFYSLKLNKSRIKGEQEKILVSTKKGNVILMEYENIKKNKKLFSAISLSHRLESKGEKVLFCLKIFFIILIIYLIEEIFFIFANNHLLDRLSVCIRNIGVLIPVFILSSLLTKPDWHIYKHQLYPSIIIIILSLFMIFFNCFTIDRFGKIYNINFLYYLLIFILTGVELVLIKYLIDIEFISIFLILGLKGIIGTIIFGIINLIVDKNNWFNLVDTIMKFEYDDMNEEFEITYKILYIISLLILQYLKMVIIMEFTENHFLSVAMISDVFYFPLYLIEKFSIQYFPIATSITFYLNSIIGFINTILLLVFNEIIELKLCGISSNMNKNIVKRQNEEKIVLEMQVTNLINNVYNEDEKNSDDEEENQE